MKKTQKIKLLSLLRRATKRGVTSNVAKRLGINRVPARIFELRNEGYLIDTYCKYSNREHKNIYSFHLW